MDKWKMTFFFINPIVPNTEYILKIFSNRFVTNRVGWESTRRTFVDISFNYSAISIPRKNSIVFFMNVLYICIHVRIYIFDTTFNLERIRGSRRQYTAPGQMETRAGDLSA